MIRELTPRVKEAIRRLHPQDEESVGSRLLAASGFSRTHQDILAFSFGDRELLERLCQKCEGYLGDDRYIYMMEAAPEEHLQGLPRKDDAAAEMARRFETLGFDDLWRFSGWGRWSKQWKKEWPNQPSEPTRSARGSS